MHALLRATLATALAVTAAAAEAPDATSDHPLDGAIVEVATATRLDAQTLAARLGGADIVMLGEVHDNAVHHERQAWLIEQLDPKAVAFEMVPAERTDALAAETGAQAERLERLPEVLDWAASGWPDWALYRPVFEAAADARLIGAGVPRDDLMKAISDGAAVAWGMRAEEPGLTVALSAADLAELTEEMRVSHCDALPDEMLPGMIEAQRLRDARFAAASLEAWRDGSPAVLVTGNGHARSDRGVPFYLARMAPEAEVLSLGQLELDPGSTEIEPYLEDVPYDFVWLSEAAERDDPCAVFEGRTTE